MKNFLITLLIGFFIRRWWGGAGDPHALLKRIIVPLAAGLCAWAYLPFGYAAIIGVLMLCAFLNPLHGEGMDLGDFAGSYWGDALLMSLCYGFSTLAICGFVAVVTGQGLAALGCIGGFLSPIGYMVAKHFMGTRQYRIGYLGLNRKEQAMYVIDGYTAVGELWLGVCLFGSLGAALCLSAA